MEQRRQFIQKVIAGGVAASVFPHLLFGKESVRVNSNVGTLNQDVAPIRLALIGEGRQGTSDTRMALKVPGIKLVAVCDLYDIRLKTIFRENRFIGMRKN